MTVVSANLNADWFHDAGRAPDERAGRHGVVLGWTHRSSEKTLVVGDVLHEQSPERVRARNVLELGVRRDVGHAVVVSLGAGPGMGPDSPDVRVTTGFEVSFRAVAPARPARSVCGADGHRHGVGSSRPLARCGS